MTIILLLAAASLTAERMRTRLLIIGLGIPAFFLGDGFRKPSTVTQLAKYRPLDATQSSEPDYVGSKACRSCHPKAYATWYKSYHRTMTQVASTKSVLAPFDGRVMSDSGRTYQVHKKGDAFFVNMPAMGTEGDSEDTRSVRPVVMTTGSHHMQAYWIPVDDFADEIDPVDRQAFNDMCSRCHGEDGLGAAAPSIVDYRLSPEDVENALDLAQHAQIRKSSPNYKKALKFATQIQYTGRLHQFPFVYLIKQKRWVHEDHTFLQPPNLDHEPEPFGDNWSDGCDQCHSVKPSYSFVGNKTTGDAEVVELGISCEACHGPGGNHIAANQNPINRYLAKQNSLPPDDIINPSKLDNQASSHVCAQCHAELLMKNETNHFRPGQPIESEFHVVQYLPEAPPKWLADELKGNPNLLHDGFWKDGTMRIAGRDYNGMAITGCFTKGEMACTSCHSMHDSDPNDQLKLAAKSDLVCLNCHPKYKDDIAAHTHHPQGHEASRCYNCHMPHTTVGLLGLIRAHRIDSPTAKMTSEHGRPNACVLCHLDKSLYEIAESLHDWYGQPEPGHIGIEPSESAAVIGLLKGDAVQRAAYAWHFGWPPAQRASGTRWMAPFLADLLNDPYSAVRFIAGRALQSLPAFSKLGYDYTATELERTKVADRVRQIWRASNVGFTRPGVLVQNGQTDTKRLNTLRAQRDNTPVRVNE
ncbi:MAG: cytochrome c3 family protein [Myxococcota bacterium]|nr:cytochrome c3 family protein [Myxococcota bacterium]